VSIGFSWKTPQTTRPNRSVLPPQSDPIADSPSRRELISFGQHTITVSTSSPDGRRWSLRLTLMLGAGVSLLLWAARVSAIIAIR
jgi:hypothetical protein